MKKTFLKNLFRDIKNTPSRFLSIIVIIAVGVAFYSGVRATSPSMKKSNDYYLDEVRFMDFKLISTLGITDDDIDEIGKQKGITQAQGSYSMDAVIEKDDKQIVININSMPNKEGINQIKIIEGRRAERIGEVVVEESFMKESKLKLNDIITIKSGNENKIKDDLKQDKFKIVGSAISPLYLSQQRQISSVGNGNVRGFIYILSEVFKSEVYTEAYARVDEKESKNSILNNQRYNDYTKAIEKNLKNLGKTRNNIRYENVYNEANDKLAKAEIELEEARVEAKTEITDAYKKINDAQSKIDKGKRELSKNEKLFNSKITDGRKEIEDGKKEIEKAERELPLKKKEIEDGKIKIIEARKSLDESQTQLNAGKQQAAGQISTVISAKVDQAWQARDSNPGDESYAQQYEAINDLYENAVKGKGFDSIYNSLKANNQLSTIQQEFDIQRIKNDFDRAELEIKNGKKQVNEQDKKLKQGEMDIGKASVKLETRKKEIAQAEIELEKGNKKGLIELKKGKEEIEKGQKEIDKNLEKLKTEEEKANIEIKDAEVKINKNKDKLNDIKSPDWYVLGRGQNLGYETYRQDSDRIDNIGKVFPLIFFLVAVLVSLTTMTRMVQEKRTEIGTLKALGYSPTAIISHYIIYSLMASVMGSCVGVLIGFRLFPPLIIDAYASLYSIPYVLTPFIRNLALQAAVLAVLSTTLAATFATLDELREVAASLMRPKPPKAGKKIMLERFSFIWNRLKFTSKVTSRNIFRYKQRLFMTVIGIAACTGLMITGFGLKDGIIGATEDQFNKIYRYDMQGTLKSDRDASNKETIKEKALKDENIKSIMFTNTKSATVKSKEIRDEDAYVVVPENKKELNQYINMYLDDQGLNLQDDGVIITEKLSRLIGKKIGDTIEITIDDNIIKAEIRDITQQYIQHYVYMSPDYYEKITGETMKYNSFYGILKDKSEKIEDETSQSLKTIAGINSIGFKSNSKVDYDESMKSINSVVFILIASAGVLAFVVIYNLTNINITERRRELATIKLLGFYDNELAAYIYRENVILTFIGSFVGIAVGIVLNKFVLSTAETNVIKFLEKINPIYFLYSVLLTVLFSVIVNLAMYKRFGKIDMIESLKSAE